MKERWEWFQERAHGTHANAWLFALSFSESSFFIVPPEVLMIPMIMADTSKWLKVALITSSSSVMGAIAGYAIAYFFFDTIGEQIIGMYGLTEPFAQMGELFEQNAFWVMFTAAFTPIPYKVAVLAGGFFKIDFVAFLLASILGRGARYGLIAWIVRKFGDKATQMMLAYSNKVTIVLAIIVGLALIAYKILH